MLSALRLIVRLVKRPPELPTAIAALMPVWQALAHHATHGLLYALFFAVPFLGWAYSSAAGFPIVLLGLWPLPDLVEPSKALAEAIRPWHGWSAYTLAGLAALHVAAALKHQWVDRDGLLQRMLPVRAAVTVVAKPENGNIAISIDIGSATLGAPETDAEMPKATWFNTVKFPQATFQSTAIKNMGGGKLEVTGKLAIKGNVRDAVVPVTLSQSGSTTTASGAFFIKRLAFKIGENEWADTSMVADDVQVKFKLALSGVAKM